MNNTCVYTHTRSDGVVFYVGIGSTNRPYSEAKRNKHWHNTTAKYGYTVTILHKNLSWEQACALEIELIAKYREISGEKLCNITPGGECGALGSTHSDESKLKMSEALRNRPPVSEETRVKRREAAKGRVHTEETRAKISAAGLGRAVSEETREKIASAQRCKVISEETRAKLRAANTGKKHSEEHKAKIREAVKRAKAKGGGV